jgi:hypothetical protein
MRPPTEAALLLAANLADDTRYELNKSRKPAVVQIDWIKLYPRVLHFGKDTVPDKGVSEIWHLCFHTFRLSRELCRGSIASLISINSRPKFHWEEETRRAKVADAADYGIPTP